MLEREGKREKALESALREKRVKQLKKAEAIPEPSPETIEVNILLTKYYIYMN